MTQEKNERGKNYQTTMFDDMLDVYRKELREMLNEYYQCTDHKEKKALRKRIIDNVKKQLREQSINIDFGDLDLSGNDQFFLWHTWFHDVFSQGGFDIVIGNPPYVSSKDLSTSDKLIYKDLYETAKKQFDLYSIFTERGINFAKRQGVVSYIVPDSIIARSNFHAIRKKLVIDNKIEKWVHLNNVFDTAIVSSLIFVCRKNKEQCYDFKYIKANTVKEWMTNFYEEVAVSSEFVDSDIDKKIYFATPERVHLQSRLFETDNFGKKCILWRGEEIGKSSSLISVYRNENSLPLITGKETRRYVIPYCTKWIKASDVVKSLNNYKEPKLIIRQIGTCINATIDKQGGITTQSVYALYPIDRNDRLHLNALLGILNSKLFDFFYKLLSGDKQIFTRIILENIKALPYPNINSPFISKIDQKVERNINESMENISIENEIDFLVYHLYNLTYDEVKIVDPETPIAREEYEKEE